MDSGVAIKTVLVAEDPDASRELVRTLMEHSGYAVLEPSNGAEAIAIAKPNLSGPGAVRSANACQERFSRGVALAAS